MVFRGFGYELRVHSEGKAYVWAGIAASVVLLFTTGLSALFLLCFFATVSVAGFFRDPERVVPLEEGVVVSPADGVVMAVDTVAPLPNMGLGDKKMKRVMIFLSVFNVHVNRMPVAGRVLKVMHVRGKFEHAGKPKSTDHNEHNIVVLESESGKKLSVVQIAGFLARRIVCETEEGSFLATGERYGIIKFGSRVDLYLPEECNIAVMPGQSTIGGETIISNLK